MSRVFVFLLFLSPLSAAVFDPMAAPEHVVVNNRVLYRINGKTITFLDVVHKMDLLFYKQYPELASSAIARYQFYLASWKAILSSVIDDQLIMADAKEKQIEVTSGDVREEMERMFGPEVVLNIHKLNMSYEEIWEILKTELTVQRMIGMMVRMQAQSEVNPKKVRERYLQMLQRDPPEEKWRYQVLTIRGPASAETAEKAIGLLDENPSLWEELPALLTTESARAVLSEEYGRKAKELSLSHKAVLETLGAGSYSAPVIQTNDQARIFFVKEYTEAAPPPLQEMEEAIRQSLMQEAMARHNQAYREKLRKNYGLSEQEFKRFLPSEEELFVLR